MRLVALLLGLGLVGCGSPAPVAAPLGSSSSSPPPESPPPADAVSKSYPPKFPVLTDAELARRTAEHVAKSAGFTIELDPFGLMSQARCVSCGGGKSDFKLTRDERTQVEAFFAANGDLLALDAPGVIKKYDRDTGTLFQQVTASGIAGHVLVQRMGGAVTITGHMWPALPASGHWLPDQELDTKLRALDPSADLLLEHRYVNVARSDVGPLEVHEAVCLATTADSVPAGPPASSGGTHQNRPCLDARTGEDLTSLKVGWRVSSTNGVVTSRALERQGAKP